MDNRQENRPTKKNTTVLDNDEVSSKEWDFISLNEAEEDLVYRMHKLIGDRWELIAGRIPGRTAEEIERFWLMRHGEQFVDKRKKCKIVGSSRSSSVKN